MSGHEQLISVVTGSGVTEMLATPQNFANTQAQYGEIEFGSTSLRLYSKADGGSTWYERDINTAFDGRADSYFNANLGHYLNGARVDDEMAMDGQGNLFIEYLSSASALSVDRIPAAMVQALATGATITPYSSTQVLDPVNVAAFGTGTLRPQLAVGSDSTDATKTAVYVFGGDIGVAVPQMWAWEGTSSDSFSSPTTTTNPLWKHVDDPLSTGVGFGWSPMTVGGAGALYSAGIGGEIYELSWSAATPAFTPLFLAPLRGTRSGLVAYTDAGGAATLFSLTTDATGHDTVASTPVSGSGTWAYPDTPMDPFNANIGNPRLAVDPRTAQVSVLYESSSNTLTIAAETAGRWSRKVVASPVSFATPNQSGTYGNDRTMVEWYSVFDGIAAVAYMQNDGSISATPAPSDVAVLPINLAAAYGDVLTVANDIGIAITLSGSALAGGTMTVGVDGQSYMLSLTSNLLKTTVSSMTNATLTVDETGGGNPIPATWGIDFNTQGGAGALKIIGAGSALVGDSYVAQAAGTVTFANTASIELDLDASNEVVTVEHDMHLSEPNALNIVGGGGANQLVLHNTGASANVTRANQLFTLGNLAVAYDASLASIEVDGPNTLGTIDLSQPIYLPKGTSSQPGLVDGRASPVSITSNGGSGEVVSFLNSSWSLPGGYFMDIPVGTLDLSQASGSTVTLGAVDDFYVRPALSIFMCAGNNTVVINYLSA